MTNAFTDLLAKLLNGKTLPPRDPETDRVFARINRLDFDGWNETEVRSEIIDPLIKLLGYDIENWASLKRERTVKVLGGHKAMDYSMWLFQEDFWVVEAKRPQSAASFDRDDVYQTLRYAAHPEINAALMMLCDGNKLEVFDRETSLEQPLLSLPRAEWAGRFDELRALLSPWQAYFFERRRITRLVEKMLDQETHFERVEEFRRDIDRLFVDKRERILDNWRQRVDVEGDFEAHRQRLATESPFELIETAFFFEQNVGSTRAMIENIARAQVAGSQLLPFRVFPEVPRDANVAFWSHALNFLLAKDQQGETSLLLPDWLGGGPVKTAIETLIPLLLNCFAGDQDRRVVVLHAAAARRYLKLVVLVDRSGRRVGDVLHAINRFYGPELSFGQSVSSPARHLFGIVETQTITMSANFVANHLGPNRRSFLGATAKQALQDLWRAELELLAELPDYAALLRECKMDDLHWSESHLAWFDYLGHSSLCVIDGYPDWKDWTLQKHAGAVVELGRNGSHKAREWLGVQGAMEVLPSTWAADRFFFGDRDTASAVELAYKK